MTIVECARRSMRAYRLLLRAFANRLDMFEISIKPADTLAAIAIDNINVTVGSNRNIGRVCPFKFLRSRAFLFYVSNDVKDFAVQIGLVNTFAQLRTLLVGANVFRKVEKFLSALF